MNKDILRSVWPEWQIEEPPLGRGSFATVYKAVRRDHNVESFAAIKVISIPTDISEVDSLRAEGLDMSATRTYLEGIVNDFVSEIQLMESLKGVQNIVSVEDYKVVEKTDEIGWDIYIRMELLTPFNAYSCDKKLTEADIIRMGCDICTALDVCSKRNVIHRDVKPENIFVNDFGYFKLGDFGIARKMENVSGGLSQKGTYNYMAPEVARSGDYDARVDIYSLGIVLYRLLNGNRLPFLDTEKQLLNPNERRIAVDRRMRGEELPPPCDASPEMADLILRACAFSPDKRFSSAQEMRQALESVANGTYRIAEVNDMDKTVSVRKAPVLLEQKNVTSGNFLSVTKQNKKKQGIIAAVAGGVLVVGATILALCLFGEKELAIVKQPETAYAAMGEWATATVEAEGEGLTYQWFYKEEGTTEYIRSKEMDDTYSVEMNELRKNRRILCHVTDKYGNEVKSKSVLLREAVSIVTQPQYAWAALNETVSTTILASGDGLTYTWYVSDASDTKFQKSSVATATYSVTMTKDRADRKVYCVVADKYGNEVTSDTVLLRRSVSIITQPEDAYAKIGEKISVSVEAVGDELTYAWYVSDMVDTKFTKSAIDTPAYTITLKEDCVGRKAFCIITDKYGNTVQTKTVILHAEDSLKKEEKAK